jgi:Family of unknown function (DUF6455)
MRKRKQAMSGHTPHPDYESLQSVFSSIAQWAKRCRDILESSKGLVDCGPEEVARIAHDLKLQPEELAMLAKKGPRAADLVRKMLAALGIDAGELESDDPATMHDLQRLCSMCADKRQCQYDLANGITATNFRDYCPNAYTLDALLAAKSDG